MFYDTTIFANENNGSGSVYYAILYDSCILKYCDDVRKKFCYEDNYFHLFVSKYDTRWLRSIYAIKLLLIEMFVWHNDFCKQCVEEQTWIKVRLLCSSIWIMM